MIERLNINIIIYLNNIVIYSKNSKIHVDNVKWILNKLRTNQLFKFFDKCQWFIDMINFLNFVVTFHNINMQKFEIDVISFWSTSKTINEILQFLNLINFYRRFIKHFNKIFKFLIDIFKKSIKLRKYDVHKRKRDERTKFRNREFKTSNNFLFSKTY